MTATEDIKATIIRTTRDLVAHNASITIRDIAEACFVNVAAVNYHFGSKDRLLSIVLNQFIDEIKASVVAKMDAILPATPIQVTLEAMINLIYSFAIDNSGVIGYLFMQGGNRDFASNLLLDAFFSDSEFKRMVIQKLSESTGIKDEAVLSARYILLFSCFAIPLFIQILEDAGGKGDIATLKDPNFRQAYIHELIRMIQ